MAQRIKILEEDIAELKQLTLQAQSPRIQNHLAQLLSQFKTELDQLQSAINTSQSPKKQPAPVPPPSNTASSDTIKYSSLTKYAWDQEGNKVKLIFSLEGVGKECTADNVDVIFDKWSVQLRLRGYRGQNYIFSIKKLFAEIIPTDSKYLLKSNALHIVLVKKDSKSWSQVNFKEDKIGGKEEKEDKNEDPSAGIMNMMKKMYEEGDENMKRTIAEAWTKANDKKSQGEQPDFSSRYDFLKK